MIFSFGSKEYGRGGGINGGSLGGVPLYAIFTERTKSVADLLFYN